MSVATFSWRRALLGRYDVVHVHWPERLVRGAGRAGTAAKRIRFAALLLRLRVTRTAVVRTVHNIEAHEPGDRLEGALLHALDRATTVWIRLNPHTTVPRAAAVRTIPHGHYRDWFQATNDPSVAGRMLFFGLLRPYKGVEELLAAFVATEDPLATLRLVGAAQDPELARAIQAAEQRDPRITARIAYVPDDDLAAEVAAAQVVVLPYRAVHNSGAAILALSLGRAVLMPASVTTLGLQHEVGADWVHTYDGDLTPQVLLEALRSTPSGPAPRLEQRDWPPIARQHVEAFRDAVTLRRQSRRYST